MIVGGRYEIRRDGPRVGEEKFRLRGHAIESETTLGQPVAARQQVRIVLDPTRAPSEVEITFALAGDRTQGRYRIDRQAGQLRALVQPEAGASIERIVPVTEDVELFYHSPVFLFVTAGRLRLRPGERRELPAVALAMPSLLPETLRLRWQRLPDVELSGMTAADYVVTGAAAETRFQANLLGLPLRMRIQTPDAAGEFVLLE